MGGGGGSGSNEAQGEQDLSTMERQPSEKQVEKKIKFSWYMKAPLRGLYRARDLYVNAMTGCARNGRGYGGMRRSYSFQPSSAGGGGDDDVRELVKAELARAERKAKREAGVVPRSQSAVIGRIDEDRELEEEAAAVAVFPRSKSHAVPRTKRSDLVGGW